MQIEISKATDKQLRNFMETELPTTVLERRCAYTWCNICLTKEDVVWRIEIDANKVKDRGLTHILCLCVKCHDK